jgi:porin
VRRQNRRIAVNSLSLEESGRMPKRVIRNRKRWIELAGIAACLGCMRLGAAEAPADDATPASEYEAYAESHPYLNDEFSPGEGSESGVDELERLQEPETPILGPAESSGLSGMLRTRFDELYRDTGLRLGFAATGLALKAYGAGDPSGSAYDIDFMSGWTLVGRGTQDTGTLVVTGEFRDKLGTDPASRVGPQLGTLINTSNAFNDRGWVVRDAYWLQRFYDGKLRVLVGRADTSDFVGQQPMQNVNSMFLNRHLSANPTAPFPGHGPTVGVSYRPSDRFYVTGGVANGYGTTTQSGMSSVSDSDFFYSAEAGWTPQIEGMGAGRYSVMVWRIDARTQNGFNSPSDDGVTLVAGQQLSNRLQVWGRYAHAGGETTNIRNLAQAGIGYGGLFGSPSNMSGLAASFAEPRSDASRDEKVFEIFQRIQLSRFTQFSAGFQMVFDPGNNPDEDQFELLYARLRHAF